MNKLLLALCLLSQISFGQSKAIELPENTFWYGWMKDINHHLGVRDLTTSTDSIRFRFWTETQIVDIIIKDSRIYQGKLIQYAQTYSEGQTEKENPKKIYSTETDIDSATAKKIYAFAIQQQLFQIPDEGCFKDWGYVNDGTVYCIEYSTPSFYSFRAYATPEDQPVKEAATIVKMLHYLKSTLNMDKGWYNFLDTLPKGCYHGGSLLVECK